MLRKLPFLRTWVAAVAVLLLSAPAFAQDPPRRIAIEIQGKAEFDVIYRRALSNATGAVLGGLIGAGIQSGIESSEDAEKRDAIRPHVNQQAWRDFFIQTMTEELAEKGIEAVWVDSGSESKPGSTDMYMVLYPAKFGFRIVDSTTLMMASFIEFDAAYSTRPISGRGKPDKEPFYLTDKSQVSYDQLIAEPAGINPRVESVLRMAARRLTNKVVYNIK